MASYASIASKPAPPKPVSPVVTAPPPSNSQRSSTSDQDLDQWLSVLDEVKVAPPELVQIVEMLRRDMESLQASNAPAQQQQGSQGRFGRPGTSSSGGGNTPMNWRAGNRFANTTTVSEFGFNNQGGHPAPRTQGGSNAPNVGRYQSRFTNSNSSGNMDDKILHTVIGNKLNSFTELTYSDTRDFIYQIIDSGETTFIRDFVEKVFRKATSEELYCALFARLISEIANRYPVMYEEMNKYHQEFLRVFEDVQEDKDADYVQLVKQKQYRMGYGLFLAELAGTNALDKNQLFAMVTLVVQKIETFTKEDSKSKAVEEFVDCLVRLLRNLSERSPRYYTDVKSKLQTITIPPLTQWLDKANASARPSLTNKARFGMMDLKDLL